MKKPATSPHAAVADIVSEPLVFPNGAGVKIAAYWDHRTDGHEGCPFVIMAPKFGETKKNNLELAYFFAANGLNVIRFDHSCHVGESGGVRTGFTLLTSLDDILSTIDMVVRRFRVDSVALTASSLSARSAIRAAALDQRVSLLTCLVGVVNIQATFREVFREDVIAQYIEGRRWHATDNVLGCESDLDAFFGSAHESDLHDLSGTAVDLARIACPSVFFVAENDAWVDPREVRAVVARSPRARICEMSGAKHEVRENQAVAERTFSEVVSVVLREVWGVEHVPAELRRADHRRLFAQNRVERERLRKAVQLEKTESEFWNDYLGKYAMLENVTDYRDYLDLVGELIGPIQSNETILDAGCGNGLLGAWLLRRLRQSAGFPVPATYVGLDLTQRGLGDAMHRHAEIIADGFRLAGPRLGAAMQVLYARADFDSLGRDEAPQMPRFATGMFDGACCSLVLSYLRDPMFLLREFRRMVRPGGRIVISSMKPHCDISVIYRDFVESQTAELQVQSARVLLGGVGEIKIKEDQGHYLFYSGAELSRMLEDAGFKAPQVYASFGDQAVVVRALA